MRSSLPHLPLFLHLKSTKQYLQEISTLAGANSVMVIRPLQRSTSMYVLHIHLFYQAFYLLYITLKFAVRERLKFSPFLPAHRVLALSSSICIGLPEHPFSCLLQWVVNSAVRAKNPAL